MGQMAFDEKRMDMMMDFYKAEILKMQRAGLPACEAPFKEEEETASEEEVREKDDLIGELFKKKQREKLIFAFGIEAEGKIELFSQKEKFPFLKGRVKGRFSPFSPYLPDLQRGEKLLEVKTGEYCFPFISLPCYFADNLSEFKKLLELRLSEFYDKGALWKLLLQNKELLDSVLYNFSDMGTPAFYDSARYFSPAYLYAGEEVFAFKLILEPKKKERPLSDFEASETSSADRDYLKRSLRDSLKGNKRSVFNLYLQKLGKDEIKYSSFKPSFRWDVEKEPVGELVFENVIKEDFDFSMCRLPENIRLSKEAFYDICSSWEGESFEASHFFEEAFKDEGENGFRRASLRLESMGAKEARRLKENITAFMEGLSGEELEKALLILTEAHMDFGKSLMDMIEA